MPRKYGYDQEKCDRLKRDRKNLTNKIYRRRQKLKSSGISASEKSRIKTDLKKFRSNVDQLNSSIWKCSKKYSELKQKQVSVQQKIYYRTKKLKEVDSKSAYAKRLNRELSELKSQKKNIKSKTWKGSDKYSNMRVNLKRLEQRIRYKKKKLKDNQKYDRDSGQYVELTKSDKIRLYESLAQDEDEANTLRRALDIDVIESSTPDWSDVEFDVDEDGVEIYGRPIYRFEETWEFLMQKGYSTVVIGGVEFNSPQQDLQIMNAVNELIASLEKHDSSVLVTMTADPSSETLTLDAEVWQN
jgi:hypothetical protein